MTRRTFRTSVFGLAAVVAFLLLPAGASFANSTLMVPADFSTIQAAVDAASPGDTILVGPGIYTEQVTIGKNLTLKGAGAGSQNDSGDESDADTTMIKAPATLTPGPVGGRRSIVTIMSGANVVISDLRVAGPGTEPCNSPTSLSDGVLVVQDATLNLRSSAVTNIRTAAAGPGCFVSAIHIGLPPIVRGGPTPAHATITHVFVEGYDTFGIVVTAPGATATVTHNRVTGLGLHGQRTGVAVSFGAIGTIVDNTISDNLCDAPFCGPDPINQGQSAGISVSCADPGTIVARNRLSRNDVGIYLGPAPHCSLVSHNRLTDNRYFGEIIQDGDSTISHDIISGGQVGVGVVADSIDTIGTLDDVSITGTSVARTQEISCCGFTARVIVK